jgi:tRNA threonylcarbamoyladenosine biosynthesis protein TsaB
MKMLVLDTCLAVCQAAVFEGGKALSENVEAMARGHQERLAPMTGEVMRRAGLTFGDLDRIVVTVGPGSFTGL